MEKKVNEVVMSRNEDPTRVLEVKALKQDKS